MFAFYLFLAAPSTFALDRIGLALCKRLCNDPIGRNSRGKDAKIFFYETSDTSFEVEVACCAKQVIGRTSYGNYVGAGVGARSFQFAA